MTTIEQTVRKIRICTKDDDGEIVMDEIVEADSVGNACRIFVLENNVEMGHPDNEEVSNVLYITDPETGEWVMDAFRYNPENLEIEDD